MKIVLILCCLLVLEVGYCQNNPFTVYLNSSPQKICPGENSLVSITYGSSSPNGTLSYKWFIYNPLSGQFELLVSETSSTLNVNTPNSSYKVEVRSTAFPNYVGVNNIGISGKFEPGISSSPLGLHSVCSGQNVPLIGYPLDDVTNNISYTRQWIKDGLNINGATGPNLTATESGSYGITVSDGNCTFTSNPNYPYQVNISSTVFNPTISLTASNNYLTCASSKAFLIPVYNVPSIGNTFEWVGGSLSGKYPIVNSPGTYKLRITNSEGCKVESNSVTITNPLATTYPVTNFCNGPFLSISNPNSISGYRWEFIKDYGSADQTYVNNESGNQEIYYFKNYSDVISNPYSNAFVTHFRSTIVDVSGCDKVQNVFINHGFKVKIGHSLIVNGSPEPQSPYDHNFFCPGSSAKLKLNITAGQTGTITGYTYLWTGPNGFTSTLAEPSLNNISGNMAGEYLCEVTSQGTCIQTQIARKEYQVTAPSPYFDDDFQFENQTVFCNNSTAQIQLSYKYLPSTLNLEFNGNWFGPQGQNLGTGLVTTTPDFIGGRQLTIANFSESNEGNYTFSGTISGVCNTAFTITKKMVVAKATNLDFPIKIYETIPNSLGYSNCSQTVFQVGYMNAPSNASTFLSIPRLNFNQNASLGLFSINITNPANFGDYIISSTRCGITKTKTINIADPGAICQNSGGGPPLPIAFGSENQVLNHKNIFTNIAELVLPTEINLVEGEPLLIIPKIEPYFSENAILWTGPNGFTSTNKNLSFTNSTLSNSGIYTFTSTTQPGFSPSILQKSVTINIQKENFIVPILQFLSKEIQLCNGQTLEFMNTFETIPKAAISKASYEWTGPNGFTSSNKNLRIQNITNSLAGEYTLTATFSSPFSGTASAKINVSNGPILEFSGITSLCPSGNLVLNPKFKDNDKTPDQSLLYSWTGPNSFTSSLAAPTISHPGTYMLNLSKSGGACNGTYSTTISVTESSQNYISPLFDLEASFFEKNIWNKSSISVQEGQSIKLRPVFSGTVNSYTWTGPSVAAINSNAQNAYIINPSFGNSGTYTLEMNVTVPSCEGGTQNINITKSINVNILGCPQNLNIPNISGNILSGVVLKKADKSIVANNQVASGNIIYRANIYIELGPGFKVDNGAVFKTEFGGCN